MSEAHSGTPRRRILQFGSGFSGWGGAEIHMVNLAATLGARGNDVLVAARPESFVGGEAKRRGLNTVDVTCRRQQDWSDAGTIRRILRDFRPDIVHIHTSADYFVPPVLARLARVPAIVMSRHVPYGIKSGLSRYLYGRVFFDRIIALSDSVKRTLIACEIPESRIVTIHHGTDIEAFRAQANAAASAEVRAKWGVPKQAFLAGIAGRLIPEKGVETFLSALSSLGDDVRGVIIGDGPLDEALRSRVKDDPRLAERVVFAGFRSDIADAMGALDVLVLASTWAEPCAAVVQQAMALGKPVIGTDIGGTPEMIVEGVTGCLVPPGDNSALASALESLSRDPAKCAAMGEAGKDRVEEIFTLAKMTDSIERLYDTLLRGRDVAASAR